jgi:alpha 1,2-mannosyltransferase
VRFHCDIHFDPFLFMQENNKIYGLFLLHFPFSNVISVSTPCSWIILGFTISTYEFPRTIETLWSTVGGTPIVQPFVPHSSQPHRDADFVAEHPEFVSPNSAMDFLSDNKGESYNLCHCASLRPSVPLDPSYIYLPSPRTSLE